MFGERLVIAGLVLTAGIGAAVFAEHMAGRDPLRCKERDHSAQTADNRQRVSIATIDAPYQTPDCREPKSDKEDDLCQQRRMAGAAEESSCIARWQLWVSMFGLGGLLATVVYAARGARAAGDAVTVASNNAQTELRAYIFANPTGMDIAEGYAIGSVGIELRNSGHTPAKGLSVHFKTRILPFPLPQGFDPELEDLGTSGLSLGPQSTHVLPMLIQRRASVDDIESLRSGKFAYYVFLAVHYTDVFNRRRATKLCTSPDSASLVGILDRANTDGASIDGRKGMWLLHHEYCSNE